MSNPSALFGVHPRTAIRLFVSIVVFAGLVAVFHTPLLALVGLLRSGNVSGRELTLVLLVCLSALVPLFVATALADAFHDRYLTDEWR